jgi:hypothetical protein
VLRQAPEAEGAAARTTAWWRMSRGGSDGEGEGNGARKRRRRRESCRCTPDCSRNSLAARLPRAHKRTLRHHGAQVSLTCTRAFARAVRIIAALAHARTPLQRLAALLFSLSRHTVGAQCRREPSHVSMCARPKHETLASLTPHKTTTHAVSRRTPGVRGAAPWPTRRRRLRSSGGT